MTDAERIAEKLRATYDPEHPDTSIYADSIVSWHNYDENAVTVTREQLAFGATAEYQLLSQVLEDWKYEDKKVYAAGDAVVMTHVMTGKFANGSLLRLPACHVYSLVDGKIARMDVYMDSAQMGQIATAVQESGIEFAFPEA